MEKRGFLLLGLRKIAAGEFKQLGDITTLPGSGIVAELINSRES